MHDSVDAMVAAWHEEMPEISGLVLEIARRATRLHALLDAVLGGELAKLGLARAEFEVLATMRRTGTPYRARPGALVTAEVTAAGGIHKLADRMVAAGLLRAQDDPADGRNSWLELTEKGVRFSETAMRNVAGAHEALLLRLPKERARDLADLLREVLLSLGAQAIDARGLRP